MTDLLFSLDLKEIRYGRDPVVIRLQVTNFQSPAVIRACTFFIYNIKANMTIHENMHFLQRLAFLHLHTNSRGETLAFGIEKIEKTGGCKTPIFQKVQVQVWKNYKFHLIFLLSRDRVFASGVKYVLLPITVITITSSLSSTCFYLLHSFISSFLSSFLPLFIL